MDILGSINIRDFIEATEGIVTGSIVTDGKARTYYKEYSIKILPGNKIALAPIDGTGNNVIIKSQIDINESLLAFFGLYSGDGAKGSEDSRDSSIIRPSISLSQREPNLVKFGVDEFKKMFPDVISFNFSLGEDSAFFMAGEGFDMLKEYYGGKVPDTPLLKQVHPHLNAKDIQYLSEIRPVEGTNVEHLSFYYFHKKAMEEILGSQKINELVNSGIVLSDVDTVSASLRRPFKKGARKQGGSSRSDEIYTRGLNGFGEMFLKILHELEDSIYRNVSISNAGLIRWNDIPSKMGENIDIQEFFEKNSFGSINGDRPTFEKLNSVLYGLWPRSKKTKIKGTFKIDPLWCYVSGLYLAEGSTPKSQLFKMYSQRPNGLKCQIRNFHFKRRS